MKNLLITIIISIVSTISYGQFHDKGYGDLYIGMLSTDMPEELELPEMPYIENTNINGIQLEFSFQLVRISRVVNYELERVSSTDKNVRLQGIDEPIINRSLEELMTLLGDKCEHDGSDVLFYYPTPEAKANKKTYCTLHFENNICTYVATFKPYL